LPLSEEAADPKSCHTSIWTFCGEERANVGSADSEWRLQVLGSVFAAVSVTAAVSVAEFNLLDTMDEPAKAPLTWLDIMGA